MDRSRRTLVIPYPYIAYLHGDCGISKWITTENKVGFYSLWNGRPMILIISKSNCINIIPRDILAIDSSDWLYFDADKTQLFY